MAVLTETNDVFRHVGSAFRPWYDMMKMLYRSPTAGASAVLYGIDVVFYTVVVFEPSILEVDASYRAVFHTHKGKLIDL